MTKYYNKLKAWVAPQIPVDPVVVELATDMKHLVKNFESFVETHNKESEAKTKVLEKTAKALDRHLVKHKFGLRIATGAGTLVLAVVGYILEGYGYLGRWFK